MYKFPREQASPCCSLPELFFVSKYRSCKQASWLRSALTERPVLGSGLFARARGASPAHKGVEQPIGPPRDQSSLRREKRREAKEGGGGGGGGRFRYKRPRRRIVFQRIWLVQSGGGLTKGPDKRNLAFTPPRLAGRLSAGTSSHCFRSRAATRDHSAIRRIMANGGINVGICGRWCVA